MQKAKKHVGFCINDKGYRRITKGKYRHWYEHRLVIFHLLLAQRRNALALYSRTFPVLSAEDLALWIAQELQEVVIPSNMVVHHMDFQKQHNCPGNLLLIQDVLHDKCSQEWRRRK